MDKINTNKTDLNNASRIMGFPVGFIVIVLLAMIMSDYSYSAENLQGTNSDSEKHTKVDQSKKGPQITPFMRLDGINHNKGQFSLLGNKDPQNTALRNEKIQYPNGVAVDWEGNIYISDSGNSRVVKLNEKGEILGAWGEYGDASGQFDLLSDVAVNRNERGECQVYVADTLNNRIQLFNCEGNFIHMWGKKGEEKGNLRAPHGLEVDKEGNVYVADTLNHRIVKFTAKGEFITMWGSEGAADDQMRFPHDIAIDQKGNVFITDFLNHRIQQFDSNGKFISKWGSQGEKIGEFNHPWGIAIDNQNRIWVADMSNHRIQLFDLNGTPISSFGKYIRTYGGESRDMEPAKHPQFKIGPILGFDHPKGLTLADGKVLVAHPGAHAIDILKVTEKGKPFSPALSK